MLEIKNLTVQYGNLTIVDNLSFSVSEGQWMMIVGPNGAGKSTALSAITQGVDYSGEVYIDGDNMKKLKPVERARRVGVLTQHHNVSYSFTVEEVVRLGRYSHAPGVLGRRDSREDDAVEEESNERIRVFP